MNELLKLLYDSNFFEDVSLTLKENKLKIIVKENPIIENINYNGVKSNSLLEEITKDLLLKPRTSFNKNFLKNDLKILESKLRNLGYYFSTIDTELTYLTLIKLI